MILGIITGTVEDDERLMTRMMLISCWIDTIRGNFNCFFFLCNFELNKASQESPHLCYLNYLNLPSMNSYIYKEMQEGGGSRYFCALIVGNLSKGVCCLDLRSHFQTSLPCSLSISMHWFFFLFYRIVYATYICDKLKVFV